MVRSFMVGTELIRDFVNTAELDEQIEELGSPGALAEWCEARGLTRDVVEAGPADLRRALELREALRELLLANTGVELDLVPAFEVLDRTARRARIELCFEECAGALVPASSGITAALGRIVIGVHGAMADGSWARLKACRADDCRWAFIDHAKNHSRAWCSMRSCGNREKARAFRERQRTGGAGSSSSSR
jgi:predicted RNA-binding Zn ribbon-like protein